MDRVDEKYLEIFAKLSKEHDELVSLLSSVEIMSDNKLYLFYLKKKKNIEEIATLYQKYLNLEEEKNTNLELLNLETDEETKTKILEENKALTDEQNLVFEKMKSVYNSSLSSGEQRVKIEISTKSVGSEIVSKIKSMFFDFAKIEGLETKEIKLNGEISCVIELSGNSVYDKLKNFTGLYKFINSGDSAFAIVSVFDEKILDQEIRDEDIVVQTSKSSGAGGQHINKTESAVKLIHTPTGISVECQDERSQLKNKIRAMENLKEKILQKNNEIQEKYIINQRKITKNAIFSDTPAFVFDFDTKKLSVTKNKKQYDANDAISGKLENIINDLKVN